MRLLTSCLVSLLLAVGCGPLATSQQQPPPEGESTLQKDMKAYDALGAQLDSGRTEFLSKQAMEIASVGERLFWLQFPTFAPTLYSFDPKTGAKLRYEFSIGSDQYNYRASAKVVATGQRTGDKVVYRAYSANAAKELLGELSVDAPKDEQRWWAYAVDGDFVYYVVTAPTAALFRWRPGEVSPTQLLTFKEAGVELGIFLDFGLEGSQLYFIESGRLWRLDLETKKATWLKNKTEVGGTVWFDQEGVLFSTAKGPFYVSYATGEARDLAAELKANPYRLSETYATAHLYGGDGMGLRGRTVFYVGNSGVFRYELDGQKIQPLLLEPHGGDVRIEYRYPTPLPNGDLFVVGLTSSSGSVGADGPVYRIPAP